MIVYGLRNANAVISLVLYFKSPLYLPNLESYSFPIIQASQHLNLSSLKLSQFFRGYFSNQIS